MRTLNLDEPENFRAFTGQRKIKRRLQVHLKACKRSARIPDHQLFLGPPGLGKTTLAKIFTREAGLNFQSVIGSSLTRSGDLAAILRRLPDNSVLFIDEIHRLPVTIEEILYPVMDSFSLEIITGQGLATRTLKIPIPPFTLIGATTKEGSLSAPFKSRFSQVHHLHYYKPEELTHMLLKVASESETSLTQDAAEFLAKRSLGTPRRARRLFKNSLDIAQVNGSTKITLANAEEGMELHSIDSYGLDEACLRLLRMVVVTFQGGPIGLSTLAAAISEEPQTIADVYEPFLIRQGLLQRTPRGRVATPLAFEHIEKQRSVLVSATTGKSTA